MRLSPFFLDKYEVSVARFRNALKAGFKPTGKWYRTGICTYVDAGNDNLPMNCVTWQVAKEFCEFDGRVLVSEAQWEYAASGRGLENLYSWGDDLPSCDRAAYARVSEKFGPSFAGLPREGTPNECKGTSVGLMPMGSFTGPGQDITRDGAVDMGANLREWVLDEIENYDGGCWAKPVLVDPICKGSLPDHHTQRGGSWGGGTAQLALAWRDGRPDSEVDRTGFFLGFRCARGAQ